jgi:hypothetical protein
MYFVLFGQGGRTGSFGESCRRGVEGAREWAVAGRDWLPCEAEWAVGQTPGFVSRRRSALFCCRREKKWVPSANLAGGGIGGCAERAAAGRDRLPCEAERARGPNRFVWRKTSAFCVGLERSPLSRGAGIDLPLPDIARAGDHARVWHGQRKEKKGVILAPSWGPADGS